MKLSWTLAPLLLASSLTFAQDDGGFVIEISDQKPVSHTHTHSHANGTPCPHCQAKSGTVGGYNYNSYRTGPGSQLRAPTPLHAFLAGDGSRTYSPDHGWTRPVKYPIQRVNAPYNKFYPNYWHGSSYPAGAHWTPQFPQVYTPTDTTQLGYNYGHVPTWQPNPAMIPAAPYPAQWHHREAPIGHRVGLPGHHGYTAPGHPHYQANEHYHGTYYSSGQNVIIHEQPAVIDNTPPAPPRPVADESDLPTPAI